MEGLEASTECIISSVAITTLSNLANAAMQNEMIRIPPRGQQFMGFRDPDISPWMRRPSVARVGAGLDGRMLMRPVNLHQFPWVCQAKTARDGRKALISAACAGSPPMVGAGH